MKSYIIELTFSWGQGCETSYLHPLSLPPHCDYWLLQVWRKLFSPLVWALPCLLSQDTEVMQLNSLLQFTNQFLVCFFKSLSKTPVLWNSWQHTVAICTTFIFWEFKLIFFSLACGVKGCSLPDDVHSQYPMELGRQF